MGLSYEVALDSALEKLRAAKILLGTEIVNYPTPISGCDAQFNRLLSDRTLIFNAIYAMEHQPFIPTSRQLEPNQ
ncbi:MAG: hypothetical protein GXP16_07335 [Gammaproteobacteria bacterium]|nr:hypothetical protein [Gammaproteobacteria bacterium]